MPSVGSKVRNGALQFVPTFSQLRRRVGLLLLVLAGVAHGCPRARLRACFKIPWESCFRGKGWMARRDEGGYPQRSLTEEQRSQPAPSAKTLRAAGLLSVACVGSDLTARCGDARSSPPWPQPKSLAAGPHAILKQALRTLALGIWSFIFAPPRVVRPLTVPLPPPPRHP